MLPAGFLPVFRVRGCKPTVCSVRGECLHCNDDKTSFRRMWFCRVAVNTADYFKHIWGTVLKGEGSLCRSDCCWACMMLQQWSGVNCFCWVNVNRAWGQLERVSNILQVVTSSLFFTTSGDFQPVLHNKWWLPAYSSQQVLTSSLFFTTNGDFQPVLHNKWWLPACSSQQMVTASLLFTTSGDCQPTLHNNCWLPAYSSWRLHSFTSSYSLALKTDR